MKTHFILHFYLSFNNSFHFSAPYFFLSRGLVTHLIFYLLPFPSCFHFSYPILLGGDSEAASVLWSSSEWERNSLWDLLCGKTTAPAQFYCHFHYKGHISYSAYGCMYEATLTMIISSPLSHATQDDERVSAVSILLFTHFYFMTLFEGISLLSHPICFNIVVKEV